MRAFAMSLTPANERRHKLRKRPLRLVYVELVSGNGGMMRDLSEEGFAVRAMMPLRQGEKTTFSFTLGDTLRIEGEGKILWTEEGGRVAGVEFLQISPEMRTRIDDWLIEDEKIESPRETATKEPMIPSASTIEELREELRTVPPRVEEPSVDVEQPSFAKIEETRLDEAPPPEAKPGVERTSTRQTASEEEQAVPRDEPKIVPSIPAVAPPPSAQTESSVAEGFFRKWPKDPAPSAPEVAARMRDIRLPALSDTSSQPRAHEYERESVETEPDRARSLPDISDILIQPHGLSAGIGERAERTLPALPEPLRAGRRGFGQFTLSSAVVSMIALTALVSAYVYHREIGSALIWFGESLGGTSAQPPNQSGSGVGAAENAPVLNEASPAKPQTSGANAPSASADRTNNAPQSFPGASKETPAPVTPLAGITPPVSPEASSDAGQAEYLQAVQLLRGRNAAIDTPEAVRLLWIAVEKGNREAEVTLAELYWRGQGVAQNCDQTRILLTAAARKGSAEAQQRLREFQRAGCG